MVCFSTLYTTCLSSHSDLILQLFSVFLIDKNVWVQSKVNSLEVIFAVLGVQGRRGVSPLGIQCVLQQSPMLLRPYFFLSFGKKFLNFHLYVTLLVFEGKFACILLSWSKNQLLKL